MTRGNASGYKLTRSDVATVLAMQARGDRDHDIAAWFGVNQGRVAEAKDGKFGTVALAPTNSLPPKGPPGIKGRRLRSNMDEVITILINKGSAGADEALAALKKAASRFDANEA